MNIYNKIAKNIMRALGSYKGFSWWFDDIEQEGQNEIINEVAAIIEKEFEAEVWDYREPDEITKFINSQRPMTPEERELINKHFWELTDFSKPLPPSITQDDGPFHMGVVAPSDGFSTKTK